MRSAAVARKPPSSQAPTHTREYVSPILVANIAPPTSAAMRSHATVRRRSSSADRSAAMRLVQAEHREYRCDGERAGGEEEQIVIGQREGAEVGAVGDDADDHRRHRVAHAEQRHEHAPRAA